MPSAGAVDDAWDRGRQFHNGGTKTLVIHPTSQTPVYFQNRRFRRDCQSIVRIDAPDSCAAQQHAGRAVVRLPGAAAAWVAASQHSAKIAELVTSWIVR
jgi:hypothetical protein